MESTYSLSEDDIRTAISYYMQQIHNITVGNAGVYLGKVEKTGEFVAECKEQTKP